jgi:peptidyl-prolyl cis-trans isomerase C
MKPGVQGMLRGLAIGCLLAVAGCGRPGTGPEAPVALVGGQAISQPLFDRFVFEKTGVGSAQLTANRKAALLEELRQLEAGAQAGAAGASADILQQAELRRLEVLARAAAERAGAFAAPSDAELQAAYDRYVAGLPASEFHVAHILVATENRANVMLVKLQGGADFGRLAREESADDSKGRGGDLGWLAPGKLPKAFTDAMAALQPGQATAKPVHTPYGWHLIKLLEVRKSAIPPLDQVKAQLTANLQQERYQAFLAGSLRSVDSR